MKELAATLLRRNRHLARKRWGLLGPGHPVIAQLAYFTGEFGFSISSGDLILIEGNWYVTHAGLLRLARRVRCAGIHVQPIRIFCDATAQRWAFRAIVYKSRTCRGFFGFGDADPSNVSARVHGAEMRVAETRAVNRALRKAYGIGICSIEEIGALTEHPMTAREATKIQPRSPNKSNGGPRIRDRLCQIIREHRLDPNLVKAYATDFCGVKALRDATREHVENFVKHLADWAEKDRDALLCQLNSYPSQREGAA